MTQRLGIDDVRPPIDNGNLPVKAVVGEVIRVTALVWREGHAAIAATLNVCSDRDPDTVATSTMTVDHFIPDRVHGCFTPRCDGTWSFRLDAWSEPISTWRDAREENLAAGQDAKELVNDLAHGSYLYSRAGLKVSGSKGRTLLKAVVAL